MINQNILDAIKRKMGGGGKTYGIPENNMGNGFVGRQAPTFGTPESGWPSQGPPMPAPPTNPIHGIPGQAGGGAYTPEEGWYGPGGTGVPGKESVLPVGGNEPLMTTNNGSISPMLLQAIQRKITGRGL